ncbi:MAG TPA: restriction endonuclease subunit S, partial [Nitrospiraceae bacterium]|nr:restriction endonuclease subunit S [Nitrospiraceae bacterium]
VPVRLGDVTDLLTGFPFKSDRYVDDDTALRLLRGDNVAQGTLRWDGAKRWSQYSVSDVADYRLREGDVILAMDRPWIDAGLKYASVRSADLPSLLVQRVARLRGTERLDTRFLKYVIGGQAFTEYVLAIQTGTAVPHISGGQIRSFEFLLPPIPEQRAIAHILGTLDDKIELNRRMNETLEAMARALFKSWFVDFDPVHAKAEGRDPGLPKPLADLFPDSFEDSELGEIPKGWEVQRVGGIGSVVCGKTPPTQASEYYSDDVPFITIPDMHGRIFATATQKRLSYAGAESQAKKMLPVGAICVSCIATAGLVVITSEAAQTNQQINTVVPSEKDTTYFWFWSLKNLGDEIRAGGSGGSVLINLSTGRFAELRLLAGLARLRATYHTIVTPIFGRILANEREFRTLAALRDSLLPKLISGELRIKTNNLASTETSSS